MVKMREIRKSFFKRLYKYLLIVIVLISFIFPVTISQPLKHVKLVKNESSLNIVLDCNDINGIIKPYAEINCGPKPLQNVENSVDLTKQYQEIGITHIRTHDLDNTIFPCDISTIFPDENADPLLESSYDFDISDSYITGIVNAGCKVFYRLGESAGGPNDPPIDFNKWAEICKHITMHYNDGWKDGYHYNIKYWELWNEPDLKGFWNGTADQYYDLYKITVNKLKDYNSSLKIGGPCTSSVYNENFSIKFLEFVTNYNIPLDFYAWHMYADKPYQLYEASQLVRNLLDYFELFNCENINTEWNINILTPQRDKDNSKNAAFTACSLTAFQDSSMDLAFRYRGTGDNNWLGRLIGFDLSLFSYNGVYKKPALSYLALNYLLKDSPIRINTHSMDAANGLTYLAGISDDKTNISILISNFDAANTEYNLDIFNLPWSENYIVAYYLIDDKNNLEKIEILESSEIEYSATKIISKNSVQFIRITNSSILPDEGSETMKIPFILQLKFLDPFTRLLAIFIFLLIFDI
jgi:hypothetical protein